MGLALLWVAPISFAIVILSRKCQEKLSKKHMNTRLELAEGIQECLETVQDIKACNQEEDYLRKLDAKMDTILLSTMSGFLTKKANQCCGMFRLPQSRDKSQH